MFPVCQNCHVFIKNFISFWKSCIKCISYVFQLLIWASKLWRRWHWYLWLSVGISTWRAGYWQFWTVFCKWYWICKSLLITIPRVDYITFLRWQDGATPFTEKLLWAGTELTTSRLEANIVQNSVLTDLIWNRKLVFTWISRLENYIDFVSFLFKPSL